MSGPAAQRAARAARVSAADAPRPDDTPPQIRTDPVRHTVDLPPTDHREFIRWCVFVADELEMVRVSNQDVHLALVQELLTSPELQRIIAQRLRAIERERPGRGRK